MTYILLDNGRVAEGSDLLELQQAIKVALDADIPFDGEIPRAVTEEMPTSQYIDSMEAAGIPF